MGLFDIFSSKKKEARRRAPVSLFDLAVGDIVGYYGTDYQITGKLTFRDRSEWVEYMLKDRDDVRWLAVCEDDEVECMLTKVTDLEIPAPYPEVLEHNGVRYELQADGEASVERVGTTGRRRQDRCCYWDYEDARGEKVLAIEEWGDLVEVSVGEYVDEDELVLYPQERG